MAVLAVTSRASDDEFLRLRLRLLREVVFVPFEGGLLVDGMEQLKFVGGRSVESILALLLPLLDGSRDILELENSLEGIAPAEVRSAVSILRSAGLLENYESPDSEEKDSTGLGFFKRFLSFTRFNRTGLEALRRLKASNVLLIGNQDDCGQNEALLSMLVKSGVPKPTLASREQLYDPAFDLLTLLRKDSLIVSLCLRGEDVPWHRDLSSWCFDRSVPWLRLVVDERLNYADVGPLFSASCMPCYDCFTKVHTRLSLSAPSMSAAPRQSPEVEAFWISMAAIEIVYLLNRIGYPLSREGFHRYELSSWTSTKLNLFRVPGCSRCYPPGTRRFVSNNSTYTALAFEDCLGIGPTREPDPNVEAGQGHLGFALGQETTRWPVNEQLALAAKASNISLGTLDCLKEKPLTHLQQMDLGDLANLLHLTAGIRRVGTEDRKIHRWAATAGNLGSVELYVAAIRVDGLPQGFYFFQPQDNSLARIEKRSGQMRVEDFAREMLTCREEAMPNLLVLFTGAFRRVSRKYGSFAYKLINLDAGVALSQMKMVAAGLGVFSQILEYWPVGLPEEQLSLAEPNQHMTSIVAVSCKSLGGTVAAPNGEAVGGGTSAIEPVEQFREMPLSRITDTLYFKSRVPHFGPRSNRFGMLPTSSDRTIVGLPPPKEGGRPIDAVLLNRATVRRFKITAIRACELSTMLRVAHDGDIRDWPAQNADGCSLEFRMIAWRIEGAQPGVYTYDPINHSLVGLSPLLGRYVGDLCVSEPNFESAALHVWVVGDLMSACERYGDWGHRQLLLRAGAAVNRLWFAASDVGLAGGIAARLSPGSLWTALGFDGHYVAPLVGLGIGHEF